MYSEVLVRSPPRAGTLSYLPKSLNPVPITLAENQSDSLQGNLEFQLLIHEDLE